MKLINKANLHLSLRVTAGILATANPSSGHFIDGISYTKQFNIPSPILNRFDVIFAMKDVADIKRDEAIADVMIKRECGKIESPYSMDEMKKFFAYVRATPNPKITDEIATQLKKIYSGARNQISKNLIINPRFMEALNRMIKASAKMRLSGEVEEKDIKLAMEILSKSHFKISEYKKLDNIKPNNSESETRIDLKKNDSFVSSPLSGKSKLTKNDSLLKTNKTNKTNITNITNKTINTSLLDITKITEEENKTLEASN